MAASPMWIIVGMIATAIILALVYYAKKATTAPAAPATPGRPSWNYGGIIGIILIIAIVVAVYMWASNQEAEVADITFYGSGITVIKGEHKVINNELNLKAPWEVIIPAGWAVRVLKIYGNANLSENLTIRSGEGSKQFVYKYSWRNQNCDQMSNPQQDIFYIGEIFYGRETIYGCLNIKHTVNSGDIDDEPLKLGLRWYCPFVSSGSCNVPSAFIGEDKIAYPTKDKEESFGEGGDIHILSERVDANITRIEVIKK